MSGACNAREGVGVAHRARGCECGCAGVQSGLLECEQRVSE